MRWTGKLLKVVALVLAGTQAQAALIDYNEVVDGDLPNFNDTPQPFTLDTAGVNVWRGSSTTPTGSSTYELDYFTVALAAGLQITDYSLGISNFQYLPGSDNQTVSANIKITALSLIQRYATFDLVKDGTPTETNPVPLPWTDPLAVRTSYGRGADTRYSWDWEVTLTTAPISGVVPVPAALPMMGGGLILLAGLARRKRRPT